SYRAYSATWTGTPATPPSLAVTPSGSGTTVYASWNGATGVARWQVLAGQSRSSLAVVGSAQRSGFETSMRVPRSAAYFAVRAMSCPATAGITSPGLTPALSAGPPDTTLSTSTPPPTIVDTTTPMYARPVCGTLPDEISLSATLFTVLLGIAKPIPGAWAP